MIKYGELDNALLAYTNGDIHDKIPVDYYRRVIKATIRANNEGISWDIQQAAAILLFLATREGTLNHSHLNEAGIQSLELAERLLERDAIRDNHEVVRALSTVRMAG